MEKQRFQWVDIAKGIGIILVVYGHVMRGLDGSNLIDKRIFYLSDTFVYSFHMPLFFILSGLFFTRSIEKYMPGGLFVEKCKTILYPYIIWSLLQTGIEIVLSQFTNGKEELSSLFTCLLVPRAQFWFLFALFFINIANLVIFKYLKQGGVIVLLVISLLYYLFSIQLSVFSATFKYLLFFNIGILGAAVFLNGTCLQYLSKFKFLVITVLLFIVVEYFYIYQSFPVSYLSLITALIGVLLVISISYKISKYAFSKLLNLLGKYSFEIYILHILVTAGVRILLNNFLDVQNSLIHIISGTLCGVFIPFIITVLFRNQRGFKILFRLP
jgi:fucose 4-O-acetylase-like acetyltransferase